MSNHSSPAFRRPAASYFPCSLSSGVEEGLGLGLGVFLIPKIVIKKVASKELGAIFRIQPLIHTNSMSGLRNRPEERKHHTTSNGDRPMSTHVTLRVCYPLLPPLVCRPLVRPSPFRFDIPTPVKIGLKAANSRTTGECALCLTPKCPYRAIPCRTAVWHRRCTVHGITCVMLLLRTTGLQQQCVGGERRVGIIFLQHEPASGLFCLAILPNTPRSTRLLNQCSSMIHKDKSTAARVEESVLPTNACLLRTCGRSNSFRQARS